MSKPAKNSIDNFFTGFFIEKAKLLRERFRGKRPGIPRMTRVEDEVDEGQYPSSDSCWTNKLRSLSKENLKEGE